MPPDMHHESTNKDRRPKHDQQEQEELLERIQSAQIDRVEPGKGHRTDGQEKRVREAHTPRRRGGSPEDDGGQ